MKPLVSVIVPVRNEAAYIEQNTRAILTQTYPQDRIEILLIDGMSDDGTREKIDQLSREFPQIKRFDNPKRIVAAAFNRGITESQGEIILIIGGHTVVAPNYIEQNVQLLAEHPEIWGTGGPINAVGKSRFGKATAIAMSHPLGIGNATHRYPHFEGYAFGAGFPAFRRSLFDIIGLYDENLVRNQDDEVLLRMQKLGLQNYISPRIQSSYFVRETPSRLFQQYLQYGFWRIPVLIKHRRPASIRQLIPVFFFSLVFALFLVAIFLPSIVWVGAILPAVYLATLAGAALLKVPGHGFSVASRIPLAMMILHFAYALGMVMGSWKFLLDKNSFRADGQMASLSR